MHLGATVTFAASILACAPVVSRDRPVTVDECGGGPALPRLRPLRRAEYANTVRDLLRLGDDIRPAELLPRDESGDSLTAEPSSDALSSLLAEGYANAAETLSAAAVANLPALLPCLPRDAPRFDEASCARAFVEGFGLRAYRRPLTPPEADELMALYRRGRSGADVARGIRVVIRAVLQSPKFLYHLEQAGSWPSYARAARLSYFLWKSMPDPELFARAAAGTLDARREARRMLADPRAKEAIGGFYEAWLGLAELENITKNGERYSFSSAVRGAMRIETRAFIDHALTSAGGTLRALLTAPVTFVDTSLAKLYGLGAPGADGFARVDLDPQRRSGILTQLSFLSVYAKPSQSSPVHRGKFVRERLLCTTIPDPPANLVVFAPDPKPDLPTRERFADHSLDLACIKCHRLMDRIGFGFEHYDEVGRWRDKDGGMPVDASGEITGTRDIDGEFAGVPELARKLAGSDQVRDCMVAHWFRYGVGRLEREADRCSLQRIRRAFTASGDDLRELVVAVAEEVAR